MPQYTENLNLTKLQDNEYYDGDVENQNLDDIDAAIGNRVEKVEGKGLSTEDFTSDEKTNLQNLLDLAAQFPTLYLGISAKAADSNLLDGHDSSYFANASHNHDANYAAKVHDHSGVYEPVITKKSGFNLDKSDSVTSTSSVLLATAKAVKTGYDKAVSALNVANSKEPAIVKKSGFNLDKSDSVSSTSSSILATLKAVKTAYDKAVSAYNLAASKLGATAKAADSSKLNGAVDSTAATANTIMKRNSSGHAHATIFNQTYASTNANIGMIMTQISTSDGYMRPSTSEQVRASMNTARVTINSRPTTNRRVGDINVITT